jgi:methyl-accepting chemotaxis protein
MSDTYTRSNDLSGKASDMVREIKSQAEDLKGRAADAFAQNASQVKDSGSGFARTATRKVEDVLTNQKAMGADYIASLAQAAGRAANEFDNELPQAAQYIRQASQTMSGVADQIRDREVRDLIGEVSDFARRQPTLVFGGAMLLGFAALRFLKSSAPPGGAMSGSTGGSMDADSYGQGHS